MVFLNYTTMQMTAKIVYYGPGLCGKTTNLQYIHQKTASRSRGEMVSLETETDRTLFFDLLPLDVGVIGGMKVRLQLYTVPGQVFYNATRRLVLKNVDGIVFVVDSQVAALDANVESLRNLDTNLAELKTSLDQVPVVFQYNKRDIRNIQPVERLNEVLNPRGADYFEAAALHGIGVFETLKCISRLTLASVRKKATDERPKPAPAESRTAAAPIVLSTAETPPRVSEGRPAPEPAASPPAAEEDLLADLLADSPRFEEVKVEFAEEDTDKHAVRPVRTKGLDDIQDELAKLRAMTLSGPSRSSSRSGKREVERRLRDLLVSENDSRQEVKRKASLEVPAHLLKDSSGMRIHIAFDGHGREELLTDAVTLKLIGNRHLERLTLRLDLELKVKS